MDFSGLYNTTLDFTEHYNAILDYVQGYNLLYVCTLQHVVCPGAGVRIPGGGGGAG